MRHSTLQYLSECKIWLKHLNLQFPSQHEKTVLK